MKVVYGNHVRAFVALLTAFTIYAAPGMQPAAAQPTATACPSEPGPRLTQILRCRGGLTIVAEEGARFTLQGQTSGVHAVDLQSKAVLIDAPKQPGKSHFRVNTPQAIAAVRGTKWAVDVQETRTSVLVLQGRVAVRRPRGASQVVLGPGEGVDVDPGTEPLLVKRWGQARIDALLARLGQ
jgi:hypothetical protein